MTNPRTGPRTNDASAYAARGAIGGAADESGVEYRRGVVAYLVAAALDGADFAEFGLPIGLGVVESVALETDDPVDDIRLTFTTGHACYLQARRTVDAGRSFTTAVEQWVRAAKSGLEPGKHSLVLVTASASGPVAQIQRYLARQR